MIKKDLKIIALATLFAACSPVEYDHFSTITGTVIDMDNGEPVGNVEMTMTPGSHNKSTGSDGFFQFSDVEAQQYTLTAQKAGYKVDRKTVNAIAGETVNVSFSIKKTQ